MQNVFLCHVQIGASSMKMVEIRQGTEHAEQGGICTLSSDIDIQKKRVGCLEDRPRGRVIGNESI